MDKLVVRLSVIVLNVYIAVVLMYAFNGEDISDFDYLFTDSLITGVLLTTLCLCQGKYHCKWMRFLCYNLIFVPTMNFLDQEICVFETASSLIYTYCGAIIFSTIVTIYLAVKHFRKVRKIRRKRNGKL